MSQEPNELNKSPIAIRWRMGHVCMGYFLLILVSQVAAILLDVVFSLLVPEFTQIGVYSYIISAVSIYGFGTLAAWLALRHVDTVQIEKHRLVPSAFLKLMMIAFGLMIVGSLLGNFVNDIINAVTGVRSSNYVSDLILDSEIPVAFIYTVVLGPIVEELICRKMLMRRAAWLGQKGAVIFCGLIFALFHGNLYQFFYAFGVGMLLGYVYIRTGRLSYTIVIHMVMNLIGGFLPLVFMRAIPELATAITPEELMAAFAAPEKAMVFGLYMLFVLAEYAFGIAGIVLLIGNYRKLWRGLDDWNVPRGERLRTVFRHPGGVLLIVASIAVMVFTYVMSSL